MAVNHIDFIGKSKHQKAAPVGNQLKQWPDCRQFIIHPGQMRGCTAPSVLIGVSYQLCRNRIHLDISGCCQQILFIHGERGKTFLPQMPSPFLSKVDHPGITAMSFPDGTGQTILVLRHRNKVNMIRHQAPCPNLDMTLFAPMRHQLDIGQVVALAEKGLLAAVTSLGNVMWIARGYCTCDSCHAVMFIGMRDLCQ